MSRRRVTARRRCTRARHAGIRPGAIRANFPRFDERRKMGKKETVKSQAAVFGEHTGIRRTCKYTLTIR